MLKNKKINVMKRRTVLFACCIALLPMLHAQCPNIDFSSRNFANWKCYVSNSNELSCNYYDSLEWKLAASPVNGRHTIITDVNGTDSNTCDKLQLVPEGFSQCARIGNNAIMCDAECIRYSFVVDSSNYRVLVHYAAVLELASHVAEKESRFGIRFQDTTGKQLPVGSLELSAGSVSKMTNCNVNAVGNGVYWKDWDVMRVDLSPWMGRVVELVVYSMDCGHSGHFGYGYVLCESCSENLEFKYCSDERIAHLTAPDGYDTYEWKDSAGTVVGSSRSIRQPAPRDGARYTCRAKTAAGRIYDFKATVRRVTVDAGFTYRCDTLGMKLRLKDTSRISNSELSRIQWEIFSRDSVKLFAGIIPVAEFRFPDTGSYIVNLTVYSEDGCAATRSVRLHLPAVTALGVDSISVLRTRNADGRISICPKVALSNRGNTDVPRVMAYAEMYGENGALVKRISGQLPVLAMHTDTIYLFPSSFDVPEYGETCRLKVYVTASGLDANLSDDTLDAVFACRTEVVDVCVDSLILPERRPHAAGSDQLVRVYVGNLGMDNLKNVAIHADVLDSGFNMLSQLRTSLDALPAKSRSEVVFPSYQAPSYNGVYIVRVYVSHVSGDNNASNDTLWDIFEVLSANDVKGHVEDNWQLGQNIPNPATGRTLVPVTLPEPGAVRLQLYSADGRLLGSTALELFSGENLVPVEVSGYSSGVYYYSVEYKGVRKIGKMNVK